MYLQVNKIKLKNTPNIIKQRVIKSLRAQRAGPEKDNIMMEMKNQSLKRK